MLCLDNTAAQLVGLGHFYVQHSNGLCCTGRYKVSESEKEINLVIERNHTGMGLSKREMLVDYETVDGTTTGGMVRHQPLFVLGILVLVHTGTDVGRLATHMGSFLCCTSEAGAPGSLMVTPAACTHSNLRLLPQRKERGVDYMSAQGTISIKPGQLTTSIKIIIFEVRLQSLNSV